MILSNLPLLLFKERLFYKFLLAFIFSVLLVIHLNANDLKVIYPNKYEIAVQLLNKAELRSMIESKNGEIAASFHKEFTARTYLLDSGKMLIEFYDRQGILVANQDDFNSLQEVRFIKNQVSFLPPRVSYYIQLKNPIANQLIKEFGGQYLEKYQAEFDFDEEWAFKVYQLSNGQVIIQYKSNSFLYEDLDALIFNNTRMLEIAYPEGYDSGRTAFIAGKLSPKLNIDSYFVYPKEAKKIIKNHQLSIITKGIDYDENFKSILYQSQKGYFILMEDFNQLNLRKTKPISIGSAHIFTTKEEFDQTYQNIIDRRKEYKANPDQQKGRHIYQALSDKYGKEFPKHTMSELGKLPSILNFDSTRLDFSPTCMAIIDAAIQWNYGGEEFFNELIYPVLAYVGEYNKSKGNGNWSMRLSQDGKVWEPWFVNSEGKRVFDTLSLYTDFYEAEYGIPELYFYIR